MVSYFIQEGGLNLNIVNMLFLFLAIVLHGTPRSLLHSLQQAVQGGSGIIIQFPFYAGIMAVMVQSGLAQSMSQWLISMASADSLPVWSFISAGIVNIFVPSGGGQWAVQAPLFCLRPWSLALMFLALLWRSPGRRMDKLDSTLLGIACFGYRWA